MTFHPFVSLVNLNIVFVGAVVISIMYTLSACVVELI